MKTLKEVKDMHVAQVIADCNHDIKKAAKALGVTEKTLYNFVHANGLPLPSEIKDKSIKRA